MTRRVAGLSALAGASVALAAPAPAWADNCSGLSDCSAAVKVALLLLAILAAALALFFFFEVLVPMLARAAVSGAAGDPLLLGLRSLVRGVNPLGSTTNCGNVAIAVEARLAGSLTSVAGESGMVSTTYVQTQVGGAFRQAFLSEIQREVAATAGSRGIVYVEWTGAQYGHYFNVVNQGGKVVWINAQAGARVSYSALDALGAKASDVFTTLFLRTL